MSFDLFKILKTMGPFALVVAGTLVVMAIASLAVFVERLWALGAARRRSAAWAAEAGPMLEGYRYAELVDHARAGVIDAAPLASLTHEALRAYRDRGGKLPAAERARRAMARRFEELGAELRRGMNLLASVGSVAPFVGLLGTVVGIIAAFEGIAAEGSGGLGAVSSGIAEALVVTALGLVVAIPAVLGFNLLSSKVDGLLLTLERSQGELADHLENVSEAAVIAGASGASTDGVALRDAA